MRNFALRNRKFDEVKTNKETHFMPNDNTTRRPFGDTAKRNLMTPEQVFANQGRIPPQATDLEEVVLGALMTPSSHYSENQSPSTF